MCIKYIICDSPLKIWFHFSKFFSEQVDEVVNGRAPPTFPPSDFWIHHCKLPFPPPPPRSKMKMDHHCPWINSCVCHSNHTHFLLFLLLFGCIHGAVGNSNFLYHLLSYHFTSHRLYLDLDLNMGWITFAVTGIRFFSWFRYSIVCACVGLDVLYVIY